MAVMTGDFPERVSAAERRRRAHQAVERLAAEGRALRPVEPTRKRLLATSFWGRALIGALERKRGARAALAKGRSYARNGSVLDLAVAPGRLTGLVSGTELYQTEVEVPPFDLGGWLALRERVAAGIDSAQDLFEGRLGERAREALLEPGAGLLPDPEALTGRCSCPIGGEFCKHQAALLYGLAARLDRDPELLFVVRGVRPGELVSPVLPGLVLERRPPAPSRRRRRTH